MPAHSATARLLLQRDEREQVALLRESHAGEAEQQSTTSVVGGDRLLVAFARLIAQQQDVRDGELLRVR
jgi:hypothetical protein